MEEQCCPEFRSESWDGQVHTWAGKKFARDKVFTVFYMPVGFGRTMKRLMGKVAAAGAQCEDWLCLSEHTSKWNMDVYLAVDKDLPDAHMCTLDGRYFSKVYEGPFSDTKKWCDDFAACAERQGLKTDKMFMWYTTCPKCAKKRGKNYVAIVARIKPDAAAS